jgi:hypothetical protein
MVFDEFDANEQGSLNPDDLYLMLIKLEMLIERRLVESVFAKFDLYISGLV